MTSEISEATLEPSTWGQLIVEVNGEMKQGNTACERHFLEKFETKGRSLHGMEKLMRTVEDRFRYTSDLVPFGTKPSGTWRLVLAVGKSGFAPYEVPQIRTQEYDLYFEPTKLAEAIERTFKSYYPWFMGYIGKVR